ncbi:HoxN/HupN/NixA family nickel/cobalt transporter [Helicobacter felis]|uniref:Nickel/cobalt efflux system n=3 Tax=Helicobacter felis TaxID=214 RepID=E7A961_HELFC|nr:HoxN/HupN/NixA family nickel/cobalt transporter [Helicobacter felis]CBY83288.1 high affinity nickel transport protein [Helicobacter felis ATCC 49179]
MYAWLPYGVVITFLHLLVIILLVLADNATLYGTALTAYILGSRHAFDADHIACIDNTVRKLTQQKQDAMGVGFYFSLGHSSVVILVTIVSAVAFHWIKQHAPLLEEIGGALGMGIAGVFLLLVGILNTFILIDLFKVLHASRGNKHSQEALETMLDENSLMKRFFSFLFGFISKSWHVFPVGFLFGLGFGTASQIALLALASTTFEISILGMLALPLAFAAGMTLFDTCDGIFMVKAYDWAFKTPVRKIYYNITITSLGVVVALGIGTIQLFQMLSAQMHWEFGGLLGYIQNLDFEHLGYYIVGVFVLVWAISYGIWKFGRIEERWSMPCSPRVGQRSLRVD